MNQCHVTVKMATSSKISSVFRQNLFAGKVALVTGGGTGIGRAITEELLFLGCNVMIASRQLERLSAAAADIQSQIPKKSSAELQYMLCNIREEKQVVSLISSTIQKFGKIDFLVNNGGGQFPSPAADIRLKGWNAVVETNLTGTFMMCKEAYNQWFRDNGGAIVNIVADMWKGFPGMSHTGAARAGVDNLTKSLAIEWAQNGVRINSVAPGTVYSKTAAANYADPELFQQFIPFIPARRLGTVEEISAAVCFLLCPAASFISGETIHVDSGQRLYSSHWQIPQHNKIPAYSWDTDKTDDDTDNSGSKSKL